MPIDREEWRSIRALVENLTGGKGEYFVTGKVIKRDVKRKLVWLKEFGDQAIPLVAFDYEVRYYDDNSKGRQISVPIHVDEVPYSGTAIVGVPNKNTPKTAKVTVMVPKVGETVLVARELGTSRIPRCLGVLMGRGWITPS